MYLSRGHTNCSIISTFLFAKSDSFEKHYTLSVQFSITHSCSAINCQLYRRQNAILSGHGVRCLSWDYSSYWVEVESLCNVLTFLRRRFRIFCQGEQEGDLKIVMVVLKVRPRKTDRLEALKTKQNVVFSKTKKNICHGYKTLNFKTAE